MSESKWRNREESADSTILVFGTHRVNLEILKNELESNHGLTVIPVLVGKNKDTITITRTDTELAQFFDDVPSVFDALREAGTLFNAVVTNNLEDSDSRHLGQTVLQQIVDVTKRDATNVAVLSYSMREPMESLDSKVTHVNSNLRNPIAALAEAIEAAVSTARTPG